MLARVKSNLRESFNNFTKAIFSDEKLRKKLVVRYYNFQILFEKKVSYTSNNDSVFNYKKIVSNKRFFGREFYRGNSFYGIADCLEEYSGYTGKIYGCIEHGVYFGQYVNERECKISGYPAVITFGPKRVEHIREVSGKFVLPIGPYIVYAHDLMSKEEIEIEKRKRGKTLLLFPTHSIDTVSVDMNSESLIDKVIRFRDNHGFQTVMVCLYYRDIEAGRDREYLNAGFEVVSAGRREDPDFLNRLHTLLSISDYTISNNVGTHIGYAIALDKPHLIMNEKFEYVYASKNDARFVTSNMDNSSDLEKNDVQSYFTNYTEKITEEQRRICDIYWGNACILSPEEMRAAFISFEEIYNMAKGKEENFSKYMPSNNQLLVT